MRYNIEKRIEFIELINSGIHKSLACIIVGISRPTGGAWYRDFLDNGLPTLTTDQPIERLTLRKVNHRYSNEIIAYALQFPHKGAKWLSNKLVEVGIKTSIGTIHNTLKSSGLAKKQERLSHLFKEYSEDPKTLSSDSRRGLKHLSPHFNYQSYSTQEPSEFLFVWREKGSVSNSRISLPFYVFLDACGSLVYIYPDTYSYPIKGHFETNPFPYKHAFMAPINWAIKKFYGYFNLSVKKICVSVKNEGDPHTLVLQNELKDMEIDFGSLPNCDFNKIPFVTDFQKQFRQEFLRKKLKTVRHYRINEETIHNISVVTWDYINEYNNSPILTWPNLGRTPYQYAGECINKTLYLPTLKEYLEYIRNNSRNNLNSSLQSKE